MMDPAPPRNPTRASVETLALGLADVSGAALDAARGWSLDISRVEDAELIGRAAWFRQYSSVCGAGPSEVLANIAFKAGEAITRRNRDIAAANLPALSGFLAPHPALFDWQLPDAGVAGYVRHAGADGVERFVTRMAEAAGILLLSASVFRSELAALPADRFRIGFGRIGFPAGLVALEATVR